MTPPALPSDFMGEAYVVAGVASGEPVVRNVALKIQRDEESCLVSFGGVEDGPCEVWNPSTNQFEQSSTVVPSSAIQDWAYPILLAVNNLFGIDDAEWELDSLVGNTPTYTLEP